jgi:hypothetical protein
MSAEVEVEVRGSAPSESADETFVVRLNEDIELEEKET